MKHKIETIAPFVIFAAIVVASILYLPAAVEQQYPAQVDIEQCRKDGRHVKQVLNQWVCTKTA